MMNMIIPAAKKVVKKPDGSPDAEVYGTCNPVHLYEKIKRIGEGTYGDVYCGVHKQEKTVVALKRILMHNEKQDGFPITSLREIAVLKKCKHPNIVDLLDVVVGSKRDGTFLVFEYCEHDLSALLNAIKIPFNESEVKCLAVQLLSALAYLHDKYIIHRDIKLSNLLYNNQGRLKIADFGLARSFSDPPTVMTQTVVTLWYRCPELLLGGAEYTSAVDIWAAGCAIGELLTGRPLLPGDSDRSQLEQIFMLLGCPTKRIWPAVYSMPLIASGAISLTDEQAKYPFNSFDIFLPNLSEIGYDLFSKMLAYDQRKRISARAVLRHEYFYSSPYPKEQAFMPTYPTNHGESVAAVSGKGRVRKYEREYEKGTDSEEKASKKSTFAHEKDELLRVARGGDNVKKFLDSLDEAKEEGF